MSTIASSPLLLSFIVAVCATLCAAVIGIPLAWRLARWRSKWSTLLSVLMLLPMVLPPTVIGYYLLLILGRQSKIGSAIESLTGSAIVFTPYAAIIATFVAASPFLVRTAQGAFEQVDTVYEDVARTLGRTEWSIFTSITIPLAWRGIAAGVALCFARAMGEFGATLMLAGNIPGRTQTASMAVYDAVQSGNSSAAIFLSISLSMVSLAALLMFAFIGDRQRLTQPHKQ